MCVSPRVAQSVRGYAFLGRVCVGVCIAHAENPKTHKLVSIESTERERERERDGFP